MFQSFIVRNPKLRTQAERKSTDEHYGGYNSYSKIQIGTQTIQFIKFEPNFNSVTCHLMSPSWTVQIIIFRDYYYLMPFLHRSLTFPSLRERLKTWLKTTVLLKWKKVFTHSNCSLIWRVFASMLVYYSCRFSRPDKTNQAKRNKRKV